MNRVLAIHQHVSLAGPREPITNTLLHPRVFVAISARWLLPLLRLATASVAHRTRWRPLISLYLPLTRRYVNEINNAFTVATRVCTSNFLHSIFSSAKSPVRYGVSQFLILEMLFYAVFTKRTRKLAVNSRWKIRLRDKLQLYCIRGWISSIME